MLLVAYSFGRCRHDVFGLADRWRHIVVCVCDATDGHEHHNELDDLQCVGVDLSIRQQRSAVVQCDLRPGHNCIGAEQPIRNRPGQSLVSVIAFGFHHHHHSHPIFQVLQSAEQRQSVLLEQWVTI